MMVFQFEECFNLIRVILFKLVTFVMWGLTLIVLSDIG